MVRFLGDTMSVNRKRQQQIFVLKNKARSNAFELFLYFILVLSILPFVLSCLLLDNETPLGFGNLSTLY